MRESYLTSLTSQYFLQSGWIQYFLEDSICLHDFSHNNLAKYDQSFSNDVLGVQTKTTQLKAAMMSLNYKTVK